MPSWNEVLEEIKTRQKLKDPAPLDTVRRKYLSNMYALTGRNVIAYYSGWLQKPGIALSSINDDDKNGLMATIHGVDRSKGLDLILHTPGGDLAAIESIIDYLRKMFGSNIRAIVPQIAMSAGTILACSCNEIVMGKQSNLGPIDPQFRGLAAHGIIEEFNRAVKEAESNPSSIPFWQMIIRQYNPTLLGECEKAIDWSTELMTSILETGMFSERDDKDELIAKVMNGLNNHEGTKSHSRHLSMEELQELGLNISPLETTEPHHAFQDVVLTIHHAYMHTFSNANVHKIIENHLGNAVIHNGRASK